MRRLARPRLADQGDDLARRDVEVDVVQHGLVAIRERHVLEGDRALHGRASAHRRAGSGTVGASSITPASFSSAAPAAWKTL